METTIHHGGCLCGAIRYQVSGPALGTVACTCTQCQRQTGSPLPTFVRYPLDRFRLTGGAPAAYRASDFATREFCAACGSPLFWRRDGGSHVSILLGSFDEPAAMPAPAGQLFADHAVPWLPPVEGMAVHRQRP